MWEPPFVEPSRIDRGLRSHTQFHARVELWSDGERVTSAAPFTEGTVTDAFGSDNLGIGVRRSLSLTVPCTDTWLRWSGLPSLELRPFSGLWLGATLVECPQGRFPILPPQQSLPATAIKFQADDYYQRVKSAKFTEPTMTPTGHTRDLIAWLLAGAGLPAASVRATSENYAAAVLLDKSDRVAAVVDAAKAIGAQVYLDREGTPVIADVIPAAPSGYSEDDLFGDWGSGAAVDVTGMVESVQRTPQWEKVFNVVTVSTTNRDVPHFDPYQVSITLPSHPAHPTRLGTKTYPDYRVYEYSSPQLLDITQAAAAAWWLLERVSARAETYQFTGLPDPRIDAGDTVTAPGLDGLIDVQVTSVSHPLTQDGRQQITATAAAGS